MSPSGGEADCMWRDGTQDPRLDTWVKLESDHAAFEGSAAFLKESINRPIITGRNLRVESDY